MGMFDDVIFEIKCPKCKEKVNDFQTKDSVCLMRDLNFWEVNNFYSRCYNCDVWIEFTLKHQERPNRKLTIKDYKMIVTGGKKEIQKK